MSKFRPTTQLTENDALQILQAELRIDPFLLRPRDVERFERERELFRKLVAQFAREITK